MRFVCSVCGKAAFHNEKLGIRFCKAHGFKVVPVLKNSGNV